MQKTAINRLKVVLAEKGKSNKWLATQLGKNETTISRWCTNETQPSLENLFRVASALDINPQELIATKAKGKKK